MSSDGRRSNSIVPSGLPAIQSEESPLVARAKAFMRRITQDQQTKTVVSQNRLGEAIETNINLKLRIGLAQDALDNMDKLVKRERRKVDLDLLALDDAEENFIESAEVRKAQRALERADLALRTLRIEKQLRLESAEPKEDDRLSSVQRADAEIRRINDDFASLIATFKATAGDDLDAQEELRQLVEMAEITRREKVAAVMETM